MNRFVKFISLLVISTALIVILTFQLAHILIANGQI